MHGLGVDHDLHVGTAMAVMSPASALPAMDHHALASNERDQVGTATTTGQARGGLHGGDAMAMMCLAILIGALALRQLMPAAGRRRLTEKVTTWAPEEPAVGRAAPRRMSLKPSQLQVLRT